MGFNSGFKGLISGLGCTFFYNHSPNCRRVFPFVLVFHCYTYTYLTQQILYHSLLRMTTMANWLKEKFCNLVYLAEFSVQEISLKKTTWLLKSSNVSNCTKFLLFHWSCLLRVSSPTCTTQTSLLSIYHNRPRSKGCSYQTPAPKRENSTVIESTYLVKQLIKPNHVILPCSQV